MKKRLSAIALGSILIVTLAGSAPSVGGVSEPAARAYRNCDQLHRQFYRYGVAK